MRRRVWAGAVGLYALAAAARYAAAPDRHIAEDSFILVESARHLVETGYYRIPSFSPSDASVSWVTPSWPAGFPLLLAGAFKVFGSTEAVARLVTLLASAFVAPLTMGLALALGEGIGVALLAGGLAAVHPLATAFAGQVFTNNLSLVLFTGALASLAAARGRAAGGERQPGSPAGRWWMVLAGFFAGGMLAVRDTDVILGLPLAYILLRTLRPRPFDRQTAVTLALMAVAFVAGWAPGLAFNLINFGSPFVSTHYATGIRLSPSYLVHGSAAFFGLPGIAVMLAAIVACQWPMLAAWVPGLGWPPARREAAVLALLTAVPLLVVNGAFPVASTGAAPRYTLPLTAMAAICGAQLLETAWRRRTAWPAIVAATAVGWQLLMLYPPPQLFQRWSRFAYLAYYSPVYVAHSFHNYPDHTNALVAWVREHTPPDALIVTPSRVHHFYYYARRDVGVVDAIPAGNWAGLAASRPVYVIEDRVLALDPHGLDRIRGDLASWSLRLSEAGAVDVFTPERGIVPVRAYRVEASR